MTAFKISTAEKIETIVLAYLRSQTLKGEFGAITSIDNEWYSISVDGLFVRAARGPIHWHVAMPSKGLIGCDVDLLTAAEQVLAA